MTFEPPDNTIDIRFEGRRFPAESEWLELQLPSDAPPIGADFVERTLTALRDPGPEQLAAYAPPAPSADFVARTLGAIQTDRRHRWRELLARYVVPTPSPEFVTRTLQALGSQPGSTAGGSSGSADPATPHRAPAPAPIRRALRTWGMPLLAAAAVLAVMFFLPNDRPAPVEIRAADAVPIAFAPAYAASPLPALLSMLDHDADPMALPNTGGDGIWLLQQGGGR